MLLLQACGIKFTFIWHELYNQGNSTPDNHLCITRYQIKLGTWPTLLNLSTPYFWTNQHLREIVLWKSNWTRPLKLSCRFWHLKTRYLNKDSITRHQLLLCLLGTWIGPNTWHFLRTWHQLSLCLLGTWKGPVHSALLKNSTPLAWRTWHLKNWLNSALGLNNLSLAH